MGAYVNPPNTSKETWLAEHANHVYTVPLSVSERKDELPVCLVHNGMFTAAGIAYSDDELSVFADPTDKRPKQWYWARVDDLVKVSDELPRYLGRVS